MTAFTPETLTAAAKANTDTLLAIANAAFGGFERLSALNLNTAHAALGKSVADAKSLLAAKSPAEFVELQTALAKPAFESGFAYGRGVYEIASQTAEEIAGLVEGALTEANKGVVIALDALAKNGPGGSDVAVATIKSTISAVNSAYFNLQKTLKSAAQLAESSVAGLPATLGAKAA